MKRAIRRKRKILALARNFGTERCIFCGAIGTTKEHVFSKRLHKYLQPSAPGRADAIVVTLGDATEQVTFKMSGPMRHWQVKSVCGGDRSTCNNGWMRELDAKMDSVAQRLIQLPPEKDLPFRVSETDQKIIVTWAIMKVMVVHHALVHHTQRKRMRSKIEPPDGWAAWIGHYERTGDWKGEWLPRMFPVIRDDLLANRRSRTARANSIAATIILQNLLIHIAYCRDRRLVTRWRFSENIPGGPLKGHLFKVWPPSGYSINWPGATLSNQDAVKISDALLQGVMRAAKQLGVVPESPPVINL